MKGFFYSLVFALVCTGCVRQPSLPKDSQHNVTSMLNDSVWYGTGQVLRLKERTERIEDVRQFNLLVYTDIDYPGMGVGPNPNTSNGCLDPECTKTQALMIFNIPLKKGRFKISNLNKRRKLNNEYANLSYIGNSGGLVKRYIDQGLKPSWVSVTKVDKAAGIVEGRFAISFNEDMSVYGRLRNGMPETARFTSGLFRIKITDVIIR
ncbi:hypothetical protein ACFPMF_00200 [Larkinella bovis]|uniref:Lipoprotein n=1 Tax=Larkinella bovis TaxID=683041 RepID=A0ABW0I2H5_9BACT